MLSLLGAGGNVRSVASSAMAAFFSMRADLRLRDDAETSGIASSLSTRSTKTGAELDAAAPAEPRFGMLVDCEGVSNTDSAYSGAWAQ